MASLVSFLNSNSGAIQAAATIVLVAITAVYVVLTFRLVSISRRQLRLNAQQWRSSAWSQFLSLTNFAQRVAHELAQLPTASTETFLGALGVALPSDDEVRAFERMSEGQGDKEVYGRARDVCATIAVVRQFAASARLSGPEVDAERWRSLVERLGDNCDRLASAAMIALWPGDLEVLNGTGASAPESSPHISRENSPR